MVVNRLTSPNRKALKNMQMTNARFNGQPLCQFFPRPARFTYFYEFQIRFAYQVITADFLCGQPVCSDQLLNTEYAYAEFFGGLSCRYERHYSVKSICK